MWVDNSAMLEAGDLGFLNEICVQGRADRWVIRTHPGRTNQSLELRLHGWLGETNNISLYARGVGRVVRVTRDGGRVLVERLGGADLAAALDALGYPGLD